MSVVFQYMERRAGFSDHLALVLFALKIFQMLAQLMRLTPGWTCSSMVGCPMPAPTSMLGSPLLQRKLGKDSV